MAEDNPTATLGAWIAGAPANWSANAVATGRRAFVDTLACMIAGAREPVTRGVAATVAGWGRGPCGVVSGAGGLAAPWAALINGTAAHALDYDDILDPSMSHPSAALVPAILAAVEERGDGGEEARLDAWLIGLEVMARLGEAMNLAHYSRGWHTTLSLGALGVAAACARLAGLDATRAAHAIGLAASMAGGSKRQFGSMAKPLHAGLAAKNGLVAARLAEAGVEAAADVLDGRWGLLDMTAGPEAAGFGPLAARLAGPGAVDEHGVWFKAWPSCGSTHRPIAAALELRDAGGFAPTEIVAVTARVSPTAIGNLRFMKPESAAEAKFCLPFCVGTALFDVRVDLASFAPERIGRADLRALADRFHIDLDPELADQRLGGALFERGTVEVTLADGRRLSAACEVPPGHPRRPFDEATMRAKVFDCAAAGGLDRAAAEAVVAAAADPSLRPAGSSILPWAKIAATAGSPAPGTEAG